MQDFPKQNKETKRRSFISTAQEENENRFLLPACLVLQTKAAPFFFWFCYKYENLLRIFSKFLSFSATPFYDLLTNKFIFQKQSLSPCFVFAKVSSILWSFPVQSFHLFVHCDLGFILFDLLLLIACVLLNQNFSFFLPLFDSSSWFY